MRSGRDGLVLLQAWGVGQPTKVAVKSKNRGGSSRSSAVQMAWCSARVAERCATVPEPVARLTRCSRSGSWRSRSGLAGAGLGDPDEQQGQPAQLNVGADAVLAVVEHR